jgi:GH43 family beta-xylosidase
MKTIFSLIFFLTWIGVNAQKSNTELVSNPIVAKGADPWILKDGNNFHYCYVRKDSIFLKTVQKISALKSTKERLLWAPPKDTNYSKEVWAPEIHYFENRWYVYFAADDGKNENHRMHILTSENSDIASNFKYSGQISSKDNKWAIDGSPFFYNGKLYFVWSGWEGDINIKQNLYIAEMESPTRIKSERILISTPEFDWEKMGSDKHLPTINEGPQIIQKNENLFLVYSAGGSWSNYYCLGMLTLKGPNPLNASAWQKSPRPVFEGTDEVISPGHCSFITIKNKEYIVYHTARHKNAGWDRQVNIQEWKWEGKKPKLGKPIPYGQQFSIAY